MRWLPSMLSGVAISAKSPSRRSSTHACLSLSISTQGSARSGIASSLRLVMLAGKPDPLGGAQEEVGRYAVLVDRQSGCERGRRARRAIETRQNDERQQQRIVAFARAGILDRNSRRLGLLNRRVHARFLTLIRDPNLPYSP